ncbi:serine protease [Acidithiobacillus sp.]|uniref:S1 family peptidase n=1 Tax=Acidithiobacillus sp. TaxID=1872118 RepID=UPI002587527B|nr:serine protease [Acidithiobacillus sp.]MDD5374467.1 serine protease [Acidithiobacillus sp.]
MWRLVVLLALLVGCGTAPYTPLPVPPALHGVDVADLQSKTVALVDHELGGAVGAYCSGVWVGKNTILTAAHCVADLKVGEKADFVVRSDVYAPGSLDESASIQTRLASLAKVDQEHDLALLWVAYPPAHMTAKVTMEPALPGQRVFTMGAPLGEMWSYSSGEVAAVRYVDSHGHKILFVQATAPISGGNSGGGLFNVYGELVGVCHATWKSGQNMNLWVHYQYVDALVRGFDG